MTSRLPGALLDFSNQIDLLLGVTLKIKTWRFRLRIQRVTVGSVFECKSPWPQPMHCQPSVSEPSDKDRLLPQGSGHHCARMLSSGDHMLTLIAWRVTHPRRTHSDHVSKSSASFSYNGAENSCKRN